MAWQAINHDDVREVFRQHVLDALDAAGKLFTNEARAGWTDQDLPALFKALDAQIERWADRADIALLEPQLVQRD